MAYGGFPRNHTSYKGARFAVLPCGYEKTTTYRTGTGRGPKAILDASNNMEFYDEELAVEPFRAGVATLRPLPAGAAPAEMPGRVEAGIARIMDDGKIPILLGGEHSITLGAVRAAAKRHEKLTVLQIDAHTDFRNSYDGTPYSHAAVMRRASRYAHIVQVGIRSGDRGEIAPLRRAKVDTFFMHRIRKEQRWAERVLSKLTRNVYVTIDVDGFDPSVIPDTGTPEPGGLGWYEVLALLKRVAEKKNIVGFDVVELLPSKTSIPSDFACAKLIYKLIGYRSGLAKTRREATAPCRPASEPA